MLLYSMLTNGTNSIMKLCHGSQSSLRKHLVLKVIKFSNSIYAKN
jgi:hypothetical protein